MRNTTRASLVFSIALAALSFAPFAPTGVAGVEVEVPSDAYCMGVLGTVWVVGSYLKVSPALPFSVEPMMGNRDGHSIREEPYTEAAYYDYQGERPGGAHEYAFSGTTQRFGCLTSLPQGLPVDNVNAQPTDLTFEDCRGVTVATQIPVTEVDLPAAFKAASLTMGTVDLGLDWYTCADVSSNTALYGSVATLWTHIDVRPPTALPVRDGTPSFYTLDLVVNDSDLAGDLNALTGGATNAQAAEFTSAASSTVGGLVIEKWAFNHALFDFTIEFHHGPENGGTLEGGGEFNRHQWFGTGPYTRVDIHHDDRFYDALGLDSGVIQAHGLSGFRARLSANETGFAGHVIQDLRWDLTV